MAEIMFYKVQVRIIFGVVTGFVRYKMKNTYSSIMVHSLMNIFGR
jgi:membrane protease YdiL (CAAX protease family)